MKKHLQLITVAICLFQCLPIKAQVQDNEYVKQRPAKAKRSDKGYIGVSVGPTLPLSDFASKDIYQENSGLANLGMNYGLNFSYLLTSNLGIAVMLNTQSNSTDIEPLRKYYISLYPDVNWTTESGNWTSSGVMAGGYGSFYFESDSIITIEVRGLVGFHSTSCPNLILSGTRKSVTAVIEQNSYSSLAVSYAIGGGFKINAGRSVGILLQAEYMSTTPDFKNVAITSNFAPPDVTNFTQKIEVVNFLIGLVYRFK